MTLRNQVVTASDLYDELSASIKNVYDDVMRLGKIDKVAHPEERKLFGNRFRVTEGSW
jgi:hypothetical protein